MYKLLFLILPVVVLSLAIFNPVDARIYKFAMTGDIHCNEDTSEVIDAIDGNTALDGVILLGDLSYHNVNPVCMQNLTQQWNNLDTFKCVIGNHDVEEAAFWQNYCIGGTNPFWRKTFTSDGLPLTFLGINSEIPMSVGSPQYNSMNGWIKLQVDTSSIIFWIDHKPCKGYSPDVGTIPADRIVDCDALLNANNNKLKIDAFVFGHQHCMAYYGGIGIAGAGGVAPIDGPWTTATCTDNLGHFWSKLNTHGYLLVTINTVTKGITYAFKDVDSNTTVKTVTFS